MAGKQISTLAVLLTSTVGPFVSGLKTAQSATMGFVGTLATITGATAAVELASEALHAALEIPKVAFEGAKESVEAHARLAAVLKATGNAAGFSAEQLQEQAETLAKSTTFDDDAITNFQAVLATFKSVSGSAFSEATKLALDMNAVMGGDLQGTAVQLGKALNDPTEGITALRRVGVSFTKQQEQQIAAMQKSGDMAGAQAIVLAELRSEFGGTAEAMGKTSFGQLARLGNEAEDALKPLGAIVADVAAKLAGAFHVSDLLGAVQGGFAALEPIISAALDRITPYIEAWVPRVTSTFWAIVGGVETVLSAVYGVVAPVVAGIYTYISSVWGAIVGVASSVFNAVYSVVASVFSAVYGLVAPIVATIWQTISENWESIVDVTSEVFTSVYSVIESILSAAWTFVAGTASGLASLWLAAMNAMGFNSVSTGSVVKDVLFGIGVAAKWLADLVSGTLTLIAFGFDNMGLIVAGALVGTAASVVTLGNQIAYVFTDVIGGYLVWLGQNWQNIFLDIVNFTSSVFSNLLTNAGNFGKALWSAIKGDGFSFDWTPLTAGFESAMTQLPQIADRQAGPLEKSLNDQAATISKELQQRLGEAFNKQDSNAKAMGDGIKDVFKGVGADVQKAFDQKPPTVKPTVAVPKPPELKINNTAANAALDETKKKGEDLKAVFSGSAESLQMSAQLALDAMKETAVAGAAPAAPAAPATAAPVAAPVPNSATASVRDDNGAKDTLNKLLALLTTYGPYFRNLDQPLSSALTISTTDAGF